MNISNVSRAIQNITITNKPTNISEGISLLDETKVQNFDRIQLSQEDINQSDILNPGEIKIEIPRLWTIAGETIEARINCINNLLVQADSMNLSYGDRMSFLQRKSKEWVDDIRENDPMMFASYLDLCSNLRAGRPELDGLPSDFTMEDYNFYVNKYLKNESKASNLDVYI